MNDTKPIRDAETLDGPEGLRIVQNKGGYRYSQDTLLLIDFSSTGPGDEVCDLGTGSGIIPLVLARRGLCRRAVGIEVQPELAETARRNVTINSLGGVVEIVEFDLREVRGSMPCRSFDYVITNPPYMDPDAGKVTPNREKAVARHEIMCTMSDVLDAAKYLLRPQSRAGCIYPAMRLAELITGATARGLEPKRLRFIHPRAAVGSELVMVEFVKDGRPGLEVMPPLFTEIESS